MLLGVFFSRLIYRISRVCYTKITFGGSAYEKKDDRFVVITGMSGAGKTKAIQTFEDLGYFCVDNLPTALLHKFIDLLQTSTEINKVAVVIDLRSPGTNQEFVNSLRSLARNQHEQENVIFFRCGNQRFGFPL